MTGVQKGRFTYDSNYAVFTITAWRDSVLAMKSRKIKKEDLPKDSLGILDLKNNSLTKIAQVKSYKLPEKWTGYLAYQLEEIKKEKDTTEEKNKDVKDKKKKVGKKNGYHLLVQDIQTGQRIPLSLLQIMSLPKKGSN